jgi:hypothetical protein
VEGVQGSHSVHALELGGEDLVHIWRARISEQHRDCAGQVRLGGWSMRGVGESRRSSQIPVPDQVVRMGLAGGELVAVVRVALVAKGRVGLGMLHGRQEGTTEVLTVFVIGSMGVDVTLVRTQRLEKCRGWIWGRC